MSHNNDINPNHKNAPSQWAQIMGEMVSKIVGTNMSTTINIDDLVIDVPQAKGPDGRDLGGAKWVVNGKIVFAAGRYASHNPPVPDVIPGWSPVKHFGGYQR